MNIRIKIAIMILGTLFIIKGLFHIKYPSTFINSQFLNTNFPFTKEWRQGMQKAYGKQQAIEMVKNRSRYYVAFGIVLTLVGLFLLLT